MLSSQVNKNIYVGNGAVDTYAYGFKIFDDDDLLIKVRDTDGEEVTLVKTTDYTVTGVGETSGGNIVLVDNNQAWLDADGDLLTGFVISIRRKLSLVQATDLRNQGSYFPEDVEDQFDKVIMQQQQQQDEVDRALKLPETVSQEDFDIELPADIVGAISKVPMLNTTGDGFAPSEDWPTGDEIQNAQAYAIAADASADAADASADAAAASQAAAAASAAAALVSENNAETAEVAAELAETNAEAAQVAAEAAQSAAAASAAAALTSENNAETAEVAAELAETNAEAAEAAAAASAAAALTSENNAATSEDNAAASEIAAAASAAAAASTLASALWRGVVRKTFADSPYTVLPADNGKLIVVDTTGGVVVINLPQLSGLTLPFTLGVQLDAGSSAVTVNRAGTDTIDGSTSKSIAVSGSGAQFLADTSGAPDEWEVMDFGAQSGNLTVDRFSGDGADTTFTLSVDPLSENNTFVYVEGVYQQKDTYSLSGTTLTFSEAPPVGTNNIEVVIGTTLSIGVPSDGTVTAEKLTTSALNAALAVSKLENILSNGEFRFWQRQAPGTLTSRQDDAYSADRWYLLNGGGAVNMQGARVAEVIASSPTPYVAQFRNADATARQFGPAQIIEYDKAVAYRGKTVTFSFWARTDGTEVPNIRAGIVEWTGTADTVTSDIVSSWAATPTLIANAAFVNTPADLALTGTMQQFSVTVTLGSTFNNLIVFLWTPAAEAQNDDFYMTQAQLVEWSQALPWNVIRKSFDEDLTDCQRFYEKSYDVDVAPATVSTLGSVIGGNNIGSASPITIPFPFKVRKRAAPTMALYAPSTGAVNNVTNSGGTNISAGIAAFTGHAAGQTGSGVFIVSMTAGSTVGAHFTADAEL